MGYNTPLHPSAYKPFTAANVDVATATDVSGNAAGYIGGCHLNGYIYLAPFVNPSAHSTVLRVDARSSTFSVEASSVKVQGLTPFYTGAAGYTTCCTDGIYVYFSPRSMGILTRYDSRLDFNSATAWEFFDLTRVNALYKGYDGSIVVGGYLYLVPTNNDSWHGYALRFDVASNFYDPANYTVFNMTALSAACVGYIGCTADERYIYYTPRQGAAAHGVFARYDTWGDFTSATSWEIMDMGAVNAAYKGYSDATYIGGYVYYAPTTNGSYHGNVLRFDTRLPFTASSSWESVDLSTFNGGNIGYFGIGNDGRYVYLSPFFNGAYHGRAIRYDTGLPFTSAAAWEVLILSNIDGTLKGFTGIVSDGYSIFYVPYFTGSAYSGAVVRFSSTNQPSRAMRKPNGPNARQPSVITIDMPQPYQVFQHTDRWGSILISGRHTGATAVEASWKGGPWQPLTIFGDRFIGSYYAAPGQGTLTVRDTNNTSISATVTYVGIGDVFVTFGQSNASGRATNNQTCVETAGIKAAMFGNDYAWKELVDPHDSYTNQVDRISNDNYRYSVTVGGSCWPLLATWFLKRGYPCAFIPAALGGTGIVEFLPGTDHEDRNTLYGSMIHRVRVAGGKVKAVLWWQGETDALADMPQATYNAHLDTLANAIMADLGCKLMPCKLLNCSGLTDVQQARIDDAIAEAWGDNPNVLTGPDMGSVPSDDTYHYMLDATAQTVADLWANSLEAVVNQMVGIDYLTAANTIVNLYTANVTWHVPPVDASLVAYALIPRNNKLYLLVGHFPALRDGAGILVCTASQRPFADVEFAYELLEQGVNDGHVYDGKIYIPGTDEIEGSAWGNYYIGNADGTWTKKQVVTSAAHIWGSAHDSSGRLYLAGAVGAAIPDGDYMWDTSNEGVTVNEHGTSVAGYRCFSVLALSPTDIYVIGNTAATEVTGVLIHSTDHNSYTTQIAGVVPACRTRLVAFGGYAICSDVNRTKLWRMSGGVATGFDLPFTIPSPTILIYSGYALYNPLCPYGDYLYVVGTTGIWRSPDLVRWEKIHSTGATVVIGMTVWNNRLAYSDVGVTPKIYITGMLPP